MRIKSHTSSAPSLNKITFPLSFIIFFSVLNGMMFQVAIPDISAEYGLLPSEVSWVMTGYILVFAVGALMYGKLADIYPVKRLITVGLILMNAGSVIGMMSKWYPMVIVARLIQAGGGAAIPALAMIVVTRYFPPNVRGNLLGIIASTVALAAGLGPIMGGFIADLFHWRYLFLLSTATVFAIPFLRRILPDEKKSSHMFDYPGALLISGASLFLLMYVTQGNRLFLAGTVISATYFIFHIKKIRTPFVSPALFAVKHYRNTVITTFLSIGSVFGMLFMVPIMLRELNGIGSDRIGLTLFPGAICAVLAGVLGGRLSDRKGSRFVVSLGSILLAAGFLTLSTVAGQKPWVVALTLIISYSGFAMLQSSLPHTISISLSEEQTGIGMGIYNLLFFISGAFSTAGIGRLLDFGSSGFCLNPFNACLKGWIYSNIFIMLAAVVTASSLLFYITFKNSGDYQSNRTESSHP
ncbi:MAG: MFS transporter [Nitrospiraceae bacterium]|nr:MAG: MFS transporter [Nitrospiraceae bacterium]